MFRISLRLLVLYIVVTLGVGIAVGNVIRSGDVRSLNSDISQQDEKIATLTAEAAGIQARYDALLKEKEAISRQLQALENSYETLSKQKPEEKPAQLLEAKQQLSALAEEKNVLNAQLSAIQIENAKLKASVDVTAETNSRLTEMLGRAEAEKDRLNIRIAQLTKELTPSPGHALTPAQVWGTPAFRSTEWSGRDFQLQSKVEEIGRTYNKTHTYILGETDCNDMAVDLWNMLLTQNIKSVIVVGNLDKVGETFAELTHAWLDIFDSEGRVIYLEATTGQVTFGRLADGSTNPKAIPYREGWLYEKPSDLRKDLQKMW